MRVPRRPWAREVGRASMLGLLLAGLIGSAVGIGWIQTRAYLGAGPQTHDETEVDSTRALFLGPTPGVVYRSAPVPTSSSSVAANTPVGEMAVISTPPAGWEGRAQQFGAGLALANP